MFFAKLIAVASLAVSATALAVPVEARATCVDTCGSTCYWSSDVSDALNQGYSLYKSGKTDDSYPHQYQDYEGFDFPVAGPWYEFPILSSFKVYTGGSPGPDRVIFNGKGQLAGVITHTGASGDDFVACRT